MKRHLRMIAAALAALMLLGSATVLFPAAAPAVKVKTTCKGDCGHYPLVILPGINDPQFYIADPNEEDGMKKDASGGRMQGSMFLLDMDNLVDAVLRDALWPLLKYAARGGKDDGSLLAGLTGVLESLFEWQRTDKEGKMIHDEFTVIKYPLSFAEIRKKNIDYNRDGECDVEYLYRCLPFQAATKIVGEDHAYFFMFEIFGDPMQNADDLNDFIQMVKKETGHDQVALCSVSLGGTILTTYVDKYKDKGDVAKIVNAVPLLDGTSMVSDLYGKKLKLFTDDYFLYNEMLPLLIGTSDEDRLLCSLLSLVLRVIPHDTLQDVLQMAVTAALDAQFKTNPQWWAMMRTKDYKALADEMIPKADYPVLRAKTDAFHKARANFADNIRYMIGKKGVEVNNVGGYNLSFSDFEPMMALLASDGKANADGMIDVESVTFGATVCAPGEKFPASYKQKVSSAKINPKYPDYSYISPDRNVDLSTALLPENTWLFYNMNHEDMGRNVAGVNLCVWLMTTDGANVHTDPVNHPQFGQNAPCKDIWRDYLPNIDKALDDYNNNGNPAGLTAAQVKALKDARALCQAAYEATVADKVQVETAITAARQALVDAGLRGAWQPEEQSWGDWLLELLTHAAADGLGALNEGAFKLMGGMGYTDYLWYLITYPFIWLWDSITGLF